MIQIMGAGALGSLFGVLLQLSGYEVVFVARGKQLDALKKKLIVSGLLNTELKVRAVEKPENADLTLFTVKAYDTEEAGKALSEVDPGMVCTVQNGIGVEKILKRYVEKVVRGVTSYGANLKDFGHVVYAGEGYVYLPKDDLGKEVERILRKSNLKIELVDNIEYRVWAKAVINSVINPLTTICRVRNGRVVENEHLWSLAVQIAKEGEELMKSLGYEFDAILEVKKVAIATAKNRSSMLQDIERGDKTEVDYINGVIIEKCKEIGLKCSANEFVYYLVKGIENELFTGHTGFRSTDI
ncbi:MAG: 2-dehydropantoate 2-reductase [Archaeoglobaceae archaeon]|nr:2-dehydropantoate 2-reductase [Archaeoglobaceae archaeon]MDW8117709.1 2-dehydropantoate 2-reductase [Archaeoglobaceae archaeon]